MEEKFRAAIQEHGLLHFGERVLVAVSGGADSVALLYLLRQLQSEMGLLLHVAHLNHQLRQESEGEAEFVRLLAQDLELQVSIARKDVSSWRKPGDSLENIARRARRAFLEQLAEEMGADRIALGHHANDQAETVLLHLLRGSGASGLSGMAWKQGQYIRPLLGITREEIESYCAHLSLSFVRDPSNANPAFLRNRLRLQLLPFLAEHYNPKIVEALGQTAAIMNEENLYLEGELDRIWPELVEQEEETVTLSVGILASMLLPLKRRAIRRAYFLLVGREDNYLTFRQVEEVMGVLLHRPGKGLNLPQRVTVRREGDALVFSLARSAGHHHGQVSWPVCRRLEVPGEARIGSWRVVAEVHQVSSLEKIPIHPPYEAELDLGNLSFPLFLRFWQPGDFFWPLGLGGKKKLQDFFVDAKVPRSLRGTVPLVVGPQGIVWIVGYRTDERFRVRPGAREVLRLYAEEGGS